VPIHLYLPTFHQNQIQYFNISFKMILSYHTSLEKKENIVVLIDQENREEKVTSLASQAGDNAESLLADFQAKEGEMRTLYPPKADHKRIILLGCGKKANPQSVQKAAFSLVKKMGKKVEGAVWLDLFENRETGDVIALAEAFAKGAQLGRYDIGLYKTEAGTPDREKIKLVEIGFAAPESVLSAIKKASWRGREVAVSQRNIMDWMNAPGNKLFPRVFAEKAIESGKSCGFDVTIWDKEKIEAEGMGGLLGVNKGSAEPPVFMIMEYKGAGEKLKKVALVGKGVTFDTGGISIKPSTNILYEK